MKEIDARKLNCPAPVLLAKETIEKEHPDQIKIIVDNEAAKENVSRFLGSQNYTAEVETHGSEHYVIGHYSADEKCEECEDILKKAENKKIMVMVATDRIGFGDDELGLKLMGNFVKTLKEMGPELWRLVFVNNGVKLAVEGSTVLEDLQGLESDGVSILVCGTCLEHYNLLDKKQVGETTNMLDIVTSMQYADKTINL